MRSTAQDKSIVTENLVLYLDAANPNSYPGSGTIWTDLTSNRNNGSLVNGPTFDSANQGSIVFDGSNDYSIVTSSSFNPVGTSDFSVSVWVNLTSLPLSNPRILAQAVDSSNYFNLGTYGGGQVGVNDAFWFEIKKAGTLYGTNLNITIKYTTNTWYNLVGTFNNTTNDIIFYVNNVIRQGSTGVSALAPSPVSSLHIANNNTSSITSLPGKIASVSMYNRVLTAAEVAQNYNALKGRFGL